MFGFNIRVLFLEIQRQFAGALLPDYHCASVISEEKRSIQPAVIKSIIRPAGRVPPDALLFAGRQKVSKNRLSPGGWHFLRQVSAILAVGAADEDPSASWRGNNCPDAFARQPFNHRQRISEAVGSTFGRSIKRQPLFPLHEALPKSSLPRAASTEIARVNYAHRQVHVLPLDTFLGRARKVSRLPAGTGELEVADLSLDQIHYKTGGSRPARRLTFCWLPKSKQKSALAWRRALLATCFNDTGGRCCR